MRYLRDQGYVGKSIILGVRPEDIHDELIFLEASQHSAFDATVSVSELLGAEIMVYSDIEGQNFVARLDSRLDIMAGEKIQLAFDMNKAHFFDATSEVRIRP